MVSKSNKDYQAISEQYIADVLSGDIPACKWTKLACQRQLNDLKRQGDPNFPYKYSRAIGERICRFIEICPNVEGRKWAGKKIVMQPWQVFIVMTVFSWTDTEGASRFRRCYIEVPKGSGKSTLSMPLGIFKAFVEGEPGSQVYSAAVSKEQAKIVMGNETTGARTMLLNMGQYAQRAGIVIEKHALTQPKTNSVFRALASEERTSEGKNPYFIVIDELHAHPNRDFYDSLDTATGKRQGAMMWIITTAGTDLASVCYEVHLEVKKALDGSLPSETLFGCIWSIDEKDRWDDPTAWAKANPSWGVCVDPKTIGDKAKSAMQIPSQQPTFKTKHLNIWLQSDKQWMDMPKFLACADPSLKVEDFEGRNTIPAFDLSTKLDLMSVVKVFWEDREDDVGGEMKVRRHYYAFGKYWVPEETARKSENGKYREWIDQGQLLTCWGETNDYDLVEQEVRDIGDKHTVLEVAYDPWQAHQIVTHLEAEGVTMAEIPQLPKYLSNPMKELEAAVLDGRFHYDGDPVLAWAVSNVVAHVDKNDNLFPNKARPEDKIDPATALLTALNRVMAQDIDYGESGVSVFDFCQYPACKQIAPGVMRANGTFYFRCDKHPLDGNKAAS